MPHSRDVPQRRTVSSCWWFAVLLAVSDADAALVYGNVGTLTQLWSYTDFGNGDVIFQVASPLASCQDGFWLRMTDPGAKTTYAQLLSAWHTRQPLHLHAYDDQLWTGSSTGRYCRLYLVRYES
jgi:hypothetical protein